MKLRHLIDGTNRENVNRFLSAGELIQKINLSDFSEQDIIGVVDKDGLKIGTVPYEKIAFVKHYEMLLKESCLFDKVDEGIVATDIHGRIFYANEVYFKILGVDRRRVIGESIHAIEPNALLIQVLSTGEKVEKKSVNIESVDKFISLRIYPFYDEKGKMAGAFSIFKDLTEINQLTRKIEQMHQMSDRVRQKLRAYEELKELNIIGEDRSFIQLIMRGIHVAPTDVSVLIQGENGVGKDVFAKLIHRNSSRSDKPIVNVNCAAIPENLIESELFGYQEGAFTGALRTGKAGLLSVANGGTLFLDEIGDMPLSVQSKLLRFLQEGEIQPIGSHQPQKLDVRILSATNQPLERMIEMRTFRKDLYYRLNEITFRIPPLRERGHDVILLANHFLDVFNKQFKKDTSFSREVYDIFLNHSWPGNVRELINSVKFAVLLCERAMIKASDLPQDLFINSNNLETINERKIVSSDLTLEEKIDQLEKLIIRETLESVYGDRGEAIRLLGISRRTFFRKMQKHGIK